MSLRAARLDEVCEINPRVPKSLSDNEMAAFLPMAAVSESGQIDFEEERPVSEVRKGYTYFERGDVLVAKITPVSKMVRPRARIHLPGRSDLVRPNFMYSERMRGLIPPTSFIWSGIQSSEKLAQAT